jgi:DNA-binding Xre family transcriptional regulator
MAITFKLGEHMRRYENERDERHTIRQWAALTGLSVNFLHRFRHGEIERLDLEKLGVLCAFFGVTPNDLIWGNGTGE